jgi:hypothetical protein
MEFEITTQDVPLQVEDAGRAATPRRC